MIKSRFSYLVVKKGSIRSNDDPLISLNEKSIYWHRILQPVKRKGKHSIVYMCNNQGKYDKRIIAKSHGDTYGYRASKKLKWGDVWKYPLRIPNKYRKVSPKGKNYFE